MTLLSSTAKQSNISEFYVNIVSTTFADTSGVWTRVGSLHYNPAKYWSSAVAKLEVIMSTSLITANAQARLYNVTLNKVVTNSTLTTSSITSVSVLSSALNDLNSDGDCIYELQIATATSTKAITLSMGRLVIS